MQDASDLKDYRSRSVTGHVIVTSRNPSWRGVASPLTVKVLEREAAINFLCQRTGQEDQKAADQLADILGCLPLALEQAAAYIEAKGKSLAAYVTLFRQHQHELLRRGKPSTEYPDTVATTWELSFQEVQQVSPAAADFLNLCAFLAPDAIPLSLISDHASVLPEPLATAVTDPISLDDIIDVLRRYSLIEVGNETVSLHRLVQTVIRTRLNEEQRRIWVEAAVCLVDSAFPYKANDVDSWAASARFLPHALESARYAQAINAALVETGRLLNEVGLYLRVRAKFGEARVCLDRALAIAKSFYGREHPVVATRLSNLGLVLIEIQDAVGAQACFEQALKIAEMNYQSQYMDVPIYVSNLGGALLNLGNAAGARTYFEQALKITEMNYGPEHPNVATYVTNLGGALQALGDVVGAKACYERALKIDEAFYGLQHPLVANRVHNLGDALEALGDVMGAQRCYRRASRIFYKRLGAEHPMTVTAQRNLERLKKG